MKHYFLNHKYLLWLVILMAFALRIINLDFQSLWLDEIYSMNMANPQNSIADIYALSQTVDPLSVPYFIILNISCKVFGFTAIPVRFVSVLFGVLGVFFIYKLGTEIRNKTTGFIAAALLTFNYFHLFYSQEARVYTMFMAFTCLSFFYFIRFLKKPNSLNAVYYGLAALAMILSHFFGLFALVSQSVIVLLALLYNNVALKDMLRYGSVSVLIVVIGYLPIIPVLMFVLGIKSIWIVPINGQAFTDLFDTFFGNSYLVIYLAVIIILFYLFNVFKTDKSEIEEGGHEKLFSAFTICFVWLFIGFFIPYILSFIRIPMLNNRYLIYLLPPIIIMLASGFDLIANAKLKTALVTFYVLLSLLEVLVVKGYYSRVVKSDFRGATRFVVENNFTNSNVISSLAYHFDYYLKHYNSSAKLEGIDLDKKIENMRLGIEKPQAFWALDAHGKIYSISDSNQVYFKSNYEELISFQSFDAWAKYFIPKNKCDTLVPELKINAKNYSKTLVPSQGNHIYLFKKGLLNSQNFMVNTGSYKMLVKAGSLPAMPIAKTNAHLTIFVKDVKSASYFLTGNSLIFGDTIDVVIGKNKIFKMGLQFDNDTCIGEQDRNIIIREIVLLKR
jgi:hypothetical protein